METSQVTGVHARGSTLGADVVRVLRPDATADPSAAPDLDPSLARELYAVMLRSRIVDARLGALAREGALPFHVSGRGEEAATVATTAALRAEDWVVPGLRSVGVLLWRGVPLSDIIRAALGGAGAPGKGRQIPGQPASRALRVATTGPLRGARITHAAGLAWASRIRGDGAIAGVLFDDAEVAAGDFHTGLNFAGVFRLPIVFVCRNGGHQGATPVERHTATESIADKAIGYGLPAIRADGGDALAVFAVVREAARHAAEGRGATLVELLVRRGRETAQEDDPVLRLRRHVEQEGLWSEDDQRQIVDATSVALDEAVAEARRLGRDAPGTLFDDVYAGPPRHLLEQRRALESGPRP